MALPRFYCPGEISAGNVIQLSGDATRHAVRVLRLEPGDQLVLFNGKGGEFRGTIDRIGRSDTEVLVGEYLGIARESPLAVTLAQAACANEKMDWVVQKAVELGVNRIQVLSTKLSLIKLAGERAERRTRHWQQVAISACEQCGRNSIPDVLPLETLPGWLRSEMSEREKSADGTPRSLRFILTPTAKEGLGDFTEGSSVSSISLLVGPEGGLTPDEEAAAVVAGYVPLSLGPRTLRTETAGLAAIAAVQALWGDF